MNRRGVHYFTVGLLVAAVVALLLTSTVSPLAITDDESGSVAAEPSKTATAALTDLFVVTAESGSLVEGGTSDSYRLTLSGVADPATYFGDRPARDAGSVSLPTMLDAVFDPALANPNAALVGTLPDRTQTTLPVELSAPEYDEATGTLSFTTAFLDGVTPGLSTFEFDSIDDPSTEWQPVDLFIDSGYHNCSVVFRNDQDNDYTLASYDPSSSDRWGGGAPPASVPAHSSASVDYKFLADSGQVAASMTYQFTRPTATEPFTVTMSWTCNYHTIGPVSIEDEECTGNANDLYCSTYSFDGASYFWLQNE
jgi:hypothetical protein